MDSTVLNTIRDYCKLKTIDVNPKTKLLRSISFEGLPMKSSIGDPIKCELKNPFIEMGVKTPTPIQSLIVKHLRDNYFEKYGSLAYRASCGSGKTLCGLLCIYRMKTKTLIVSTRNAVIDQWLKSIRDLFPNTKVFNCESSKSNFDEYDIWILTPQYINCNPDIPIKPGLIIYDEIHTVLSSSNYDKGPIDRDVHSTEFANVLKLPFIRAREWGGLPYMLSLSATYPNSTDRTGKVITTIFGPIRCVPIDKITEIPVNIFDIRSIFDDETRGKFDEKWFPPDDMQCIDLFIKGLIERKFDSNPIVNSLLKCPPIHPSRERKGIVMTSRIDSSAWTAITIQRRLNANVLLLRRVDEKSIYIEKGKYSDFEIRPTLTYKELLIRGIGISDSNYRKYIDDTEVIVSTYSRVKEGFSIENIVWGWCTCYIWSPLARVQLIGRIRRTSEDEGLNTYPRVMYVCSSKIPNNKFSTAVRQHRIKPQITYDIEFEKLLFSRENYHYVI